MGLPMRKILTLIVMLAVAVGCCPLAASASEGDSVIAERYSAAMLAQAYKAPAAPKAANPMKVSGCTVAVSLTKGKTASVAAGKAYRFSRKAKGAISYSRVAKGSSKYLFVNKKTGTITVSKKVPKGTQSVKVCVCAKGTSEYNAKKSVVTVKVKVKSNANLAKPLSQAYVGKYRQLVYTREATGSYFGWLPAGSLFSERLLTVTSIKGNTVKFKVRYFNIYMGAYMHTKAISTRVKSGRGDFSFSTDWGERGRGHIKFLSGKRIKLYMGITHHPHSVMQSIGIKEPIVMKKGTQKLY